MPHDLTVRQLIHRLQTFDPDLPVRLAIQPDWPFSHYIGSIVDGQGETERTVFIGEAGQEGYLPPAIRSLLGWSDTR